MPYEVDNRGGTRPFKIVNKISGKVVGSSETRANAEASIRARHMGEHNEPRKHK